MPHATLELIGKDGPEEITMGGRFSAYPPIAGHHLVPPGRLERPLLAPEANALSTELRGLTPALYHRGGGHEMAASLPLAGLPGTTSQGRAPAVGRHYPDCLLVLRGRAQLSLHEQYPLQRREVRQKRQQP